MRKVDEYFQHAAECRDMARIASAAHRQQLEQMAMTWEQLAVSRQRRLARNGETDDNTTDE